MQPDFKTWLNRKPSGRKPKKRVRRVSKKRQREGKAYSLLRAAYLLANPACQGWRHILTAHPEVVGPACCPRAQEIHHKAGRLGGNYLNTDTWLAVSRWAHRWIHANPSKARAIGLLT